VSLKWSGRSRPAGAPVVVALAVYLTFLAVIGAGYHFNPSAFIGLGTANPLNDPAALPDGLVVFQGIGYDGQHFYQTALSLVRGERPAVPAVRVQRIGYPLAAALLSFGQERAIPYTMIAVNLLAIAMGTTIFIRLLRRHGLSPWWSLLFALNPGQILAVQMDLALPMVMAFAAGAWLCWEKRRLWAAGALLAAALLTRESAVLFVIPLVAAEAMAKRWRGAVILSFSVVPFLAWQGVLRLWLRTGGMAVSAGQIVAPGAGMAAALGNAAARISEGLAAMARQGSVVAVMALTVAALGVAIWKIRKGYDAYTDGIIVQALFALCASIDIWEAYASAGRVFAGIFPLLVLSYAVRRERWTLLLLALTAALAFFTLLRPFVISPHVAFIVTG
jgi:hypothetical protein